MNVWFSLMLTYFRSVSCDMSRFVDISCFFFYTETKNWGTIEFKTSCFDRSIFPLRMVRVVSSTVWCLEMSCHIAFSSDWSLAFVFFFFVFFGFVLICFFLLKLYNVFLFIIRATVLVTYVGKFYIVLSVSDTAKDKTIDRQENIQ